MLMLYTRKLLPWNSSYSTRLSIVHVHNIFLYSFAHNCKYKAIIGSRLRPPLRNSQWVFPVFIDEQNLVGISPVVPVVIYAVCLSVCLSVPFYDFVRFARRRYARNAASNTFSRGQQGSLYSRPHSGSVTLLQELISIKSLIFTI